MIKITKKQIAVVGVIALFLELLAIYLIGTNAKNIENSSNMTTTPYICWSKLNSNSFDFYSLHPLMFKNTQVSIQENLIFTDKTYSKIYWYQFVFAVNDFNKTKSYIELEKWEYLNGNIVENKFEYKKQVNINITNLQPINYTINKNNISVTFTSFNSTQKQSFIINYTIPEGVELSNNFTQNILILNKTGFYSSYIFNYEIDTYNITLYNMLKNYYFCQIR